MLGALNELMRDVRLKLLMENDIEHYGHFKMWRIF